MPKNYRIGFGLVSAFYLGVLAATLIATVDGRPSFSGMLTEPWSLLLSYVYPATTNGRIVLTATIGALLNIVLFYFAFRIAYAQSWLNHRALKDKTPV